MRWILFIFGMIIDVGPKFLLSIIHTLAHDLEVKLTDLEIFMLKFCVKVFKIS